MIYFDTATIVVYGLLTAAILSVWLPQSLNQVTRVPVWIMLSGISAAMGIYYGIVEYGRVLYLAGLGYFCYLVKHRNLNKYLRIASGFIVIGMVVALFLHGVSYFNNPLVFDQFFLSDQSSVYTRYWNFDKAAAGLILLACFGDICRSTIDWKLLARQSYIVSIVTIALSLLLALTFGYIKIDITLVSAYFAWAWANLLFTLQLHKKPV
jgi:hypothetical protein